MAYVLTWLPFNVFITVYESDPSIYNNKNMVYFRFATHYLAMCHTITNPTIYYLMNSQFRRAFQKVFTSCCFIKCKKKCLRGPVIVCEPSLSSEKSSAASSNV